MIKGLCFVQVKRQKRLLETSKKIQFHESQSIEQELRIDQVIQRLQNGFIKYFDRSINTFECSKCV